MSRGRGLSLIGARGTGKSTIGALVSSYSTRPFADTDVVVENNAGKSIRALFDEDGEAVFRDLEEQVLAALMTASRTLVLATGGGIVLREVNRRRLRDHGMVVWLTAGPELLAHRLASDPRSGDQRPALTAAGPIAELGAVLAARSPLYREIADAIVATDGRTPDEVAALVLDAWNTWKPDRSPH